MTRVCAVAMVVLLSIACRGESTRPPQIEPAAKNLLLVTIDTLRADRVGVYGDTSARTPAMDGPAARSSSRTPPMEMPARATGGGAVWRRRFGTRSPRSSLESLK